MAVDSYNILFAPPPSIGVVNGGVRMQATKTAEWLEKMGHTVVRFNPWTLHNTEEFDLVHLFVAGYESRALIERLRKQNIKTVLSSVFYTKRSPTIIKSSLFLAKTARRMNPDFHTDFSIKAECCKSADLILPNTLAEADLITSGFGISTSKCMVVPNGVDPDFAKATPSLFFKKYGIKHFALFTGDAAAPRKRVLSLIKAALSIDIPLVIIGDFDDSDYSCACKALISDSDRIIHIPSLDHNDPLLASAYSAASLFVLPSLFETPGIAALEAALADCTIAITSRGGTTDYFQNDAIYIDPTSDKSLSKALREGLNTSSSSALKQRILNKFTWQKIAGKTVDAYETLFNIQN